jgi:hypothetical protein
MGTTRPVARPDQPVQIEPHNAALWAIWMTAGEVAYYNALIEETLADDDGDSKDIRDLIKERRAALREMRQASNEAMRSGLSESHLRMVERMAGIVGDAIIEVTDRLRLTERQRESLPRILEEVLGRMEVGGDPAAQIQHAENIAA